MAATLSSVMLFYILLTVALTAIGWMVRKRNGALIGLTLGLVTSTGLWLAVGRKAVQNEGYSEMEHSTSGSSKWNEWTSWENTGHGCGLVHGGGGYDSETMI